MIFENMQVWKLSTRLAVDIFQLVENLKHYSFRDQITRSAISVPSNISEGAERRTQKELLMFLGYAKGSCAELRTQLYIGMEAGIIDREQAKSHIETTKNISGMLYNLMDSIQRQQNGE